MEPVDSAKCLVRVIEEMGEHLGHSLGWKRQVASRLGMDPGTLGKLLSGERKGVSARTVDQARARCPRFAELLAGQEAGTTGATPSLWTMNLPWGEGRLVFTLCEPNQCWQTDRQAPTDAWLGLWDLGREWHASHVMTGASGIGPTAQEALAGLRRELQTRRCAMKVALESAAAPAPPAPTPEGTVQS